MLSIADLAARYGTTKTSIHRMRKARPDFPQPIRPLSPKGWPRWREADIKAWEEAQVLEAKKQAGKQ